MATFQKMVFTGVAGALLTLSSAGLNAAEGDSDDRRVARAEDGAGGGAGAGGAVGGISMASAITLGVVGLGLIVVAEDGDSGGPTSTRPPLNPPAPTTTTTTTTTGT